MTAPDPTVRDQVSEYLLETKGDLDWDQQADGLLAAGLLRSEPEEYTEAYVEWAVLEEDGERWPHLSERDARSILRDGDQVQCRTVTRGPWRDA